MRCIPIYLFFILGNKYNLTIDYVREYQEEGVPYEGESDIVCEELNELEIESEEAMVEKEISIKQ